ncbi:MAG: hypothetical protein VB081_00680, partial [Christensenella sp.]|uniref:hypothetical protein n=1 Tax=Christensenella sp. TaxID=1935934 RepID=UPI002B1F21B7
MGLVWDKNKKKWIDDGKAYQPQKATAQSAVRSPKGTGSFVGNLREYAAHVAALKNQKKIAPINVLNVQKPQSNIESQTSSRDALASASQAIAKQSEEIGKRRGSAEQATGDMVWSLAYGRYVPKETEAQLKEQAAQRPYEPKNTAPPSIDKKANFVSAGNETLGQRVKPAIDTSSEIAVIQKQIEQLRSTPIDANYQNPNDPNFNYADHLKQISNLEGQIEDIKSGAYHQEAKNTFDTIIKGMAREYTQNPKEFERLAKVGAQINPTQKAKDRTDDELYSVPDMTGGMVTYEVQKKDAYAKEWSDDELLLLNYLYGSGRNGDAKLFEEILERDVNARYAQKTRDALSKEFGTAEGQTPNAGQ